MMETFLTSLSPHANVLFTLGACFGLFLASSGINSDLKLLVWIGALIAVPNFLALIAITVWA